MSNNHFFVALYLLSLLPAAIAASAYSEPNADTEQAQQIVQKCVDQTGKINRLRSSYTYKFRDEIRNLDPSGHLKSTHSSRYEVLYFGGKPYEHLLEKDGHKLSSSEQKREEDKMNRAAGEASRLTPEQLVARQRKLDRERDEQNGWLRYIGAAYDFKLQPETVLNDRGTFVIRATPKKDYRGKYSSLLRKTSGKFFVDKHDYTLTRLEAEVLDRISLGLFLARLSPGTRITFEQTLINNEVWLPRQATVHADARALVKTFRFDESLQFSDYRKFQSDSRIVSSGEPINPR